MFRDVDNTLAELLKADLPVEFAQRVTSSFSTPDSSFPPGWVNLPTINLFLFHVEPDLEKRESEPQLVRGIDGNVVRVPAPARLRCHYMITAWAKTGVPHPEQDEHQMLGEAMRVLLRHREIPRQVLCGELKDQSTTVRGLVRADMSNGFEPWQALGSRPRAAFEYTVTISMDVHPPESVGKMVGVG